MKWYQQGKADCEQSIIISSRVRLARNLSKYPFSMLISDSDAKAVIAETVDALRGNFNFTDLNAIGAQELRRLLERHTISPWLAASKKPKALVTDADEAISIMLNEEDHIRIQSVFADDNLDEAWALADKVDNLIEESLEYAFDKDFGYLTSCPTNTGTGMRASYMVHLPLLERTGHLRDLIQTLGKFGMTIRGIYGEGSEPQGSIYQISNQLTLGKTEQEIMETLKSITGQITGHEQSFRDRSLSSHRVELEDRVCRSYGIITSCRKIAVTEAMSLLSDIRLGLGLGILDRPAPKLNIYNIMMNIHPANLRHLTGAADGISGQDEEVLRADYIKNLFI